jgi:hypothetical protein
VDLLWRWCLQNVLDAGFKDGEHVVAIKKVAASACWMGDRYDFY